MNIFSPELTGVGKTLNLNLQKTHPKHMDFRPENFASLGRSINETGQKIGADMVIRSGTFEQAMLGALDKVSAYQQFASGLHEAAIIDPDSVDVHDITIAQAEASMALNITRNVLNRLVQSWRDLINTR